MPSTTKTPTTLTFNKLPDRTVTILKADEIVPDEKKLSDSNNWTFLESLGTPLRNSLNKCWYHASLNLLGIPTVRPFFTNVSSSLSDFEIGLINALSTIFNGKSTLAVDNFFHSRTLMDSIIVLVNLQFLISLNI